MAKFDTPSQLPKPLAEAGYTLLPVRNGQYRLIRGDLFVEITKCTEAEFFDPQLPFVLETAGRGSSEAQYIDQAFNSGLLASFVDVGDMYLTIRSREYTNYFELWLGEEMLDVESVQIEVDAGYESIDSLVLVEAKIGVPDYFNVRQLYYPYRHFSTIVGHKSIRLIFLTYDISTATYSLYEYAFTDPLDPSSIQLMRSGAFRLTETKSLSIHELVDTNFRFGRRDIVPQADDLNRIFELLTLVDADINTSEDVADWFMFAKRQSSYYREAAEYLGLLDLDSGLYQLTNVGIQVLTSTPENQSALLAKAVVNSWVFADLLKEAEQNNNFFTDADIEAIISTLKQSNGTPRYSGTTILRRRQTIVAWIRWLADEMGCFEVFDDGYVVL